MTELEIELLRRIADLEAEGPGADPDPGMRLTGDARTLAGRQKGLQALERQFGPRLSRLHPGAVTPAERLKDWRALRSLEAQGLIVQTATRGTRATNVRLTRAGKAAARKLDQAARGGGQADG
jgi:hypothetical protein